MKRRRWHEGGVAILPLAGVYSCAMALVLDVSSAALGRDWRPDRSRPIVVEEVRSVHEAWRRSLESLMYVAVVRGRVPETPRGANQTFRRHFAAKGLLRFTESQHLYTGLDWEDDLNWNRVWMRPGAVHVLWVINRYCERSGKSASVQTNPKLRDVFWDFYLICIGWWPVCDNEDGKGRGAETPPSAVHTVLESKGVTVAPALETVGGRPCYVVHATRSYSTDSLWLDARRGCVMVRRSSWNKRLGVGEYIENGDFRLVAPDIWLPWRVSRTVYLGAPSDDGLEAGAEILAVASLSVLDMEVNFQSEEYFRPEWPPGTIVYNHDTSQVEVEPGGLDMLDDVARVSRRLMARAAGRWDSASVSLARVRTATRRFWACFGVPFVLGLVVGGRRRGKRNRQGGQASGLCSRQAAG